MLRGAGGRFQDPHRSKPRAYNRELRQSVSRGSDRAEKAWTGTYETRQEVEDSEVVVLRKSRPRTKGFPNLFRRMKSLKGRAPTRESRCSSTQNASQEEEEEEREQVEDESYADDYVVMDAPFRDEPMDDDDDESAFQDLSIPVRHVEFPREDPTTVSAVSEATMIPLKSSRQAARAGNDDFFASAWNQLWPVQEEEDAWQDRAVLGNVQKDQALSFRTNKWNNALNDFFVQGYDDEVEFMDEVLLDHIDDACLNVAGVKRGQEMNTRGWSARSTVAGVTRGQEMNARGWSTRSNVAGVTRGQEMNARGWSTRSRATRGGSTVHAANTRTVRQVLDGNTVYHSIKKRRDNQDEGTVNTLVIEVRRDATNDESPPTRLRVAGVKNKKTNKKFPGFFRKRRQEAEEEQGVVNLRLMFD